MQLINSLIRYFSLSKWHYALGGEGMIVMASSPESSSGRPVPQNCGRLCGKKNKL